MRPANVAVLLPDALDDDVVQMPAQPGDAPLLAARLWDLPAWARHARELLRAARRARAGRSRGARPGLHALRGGAAAPPGRSAPARRAAPGRLARVASARRLRRLGRALPRDAPGVEPRPLSRSAGPAARPGSVRAAAQCNRSSVLAAELSSTKRTPRPPGAMARPKRSPPESNGSIVFVSTCDAGEGIDLDRVAVVAVHGDEVPVGGEGHPEGCAEAPSRAHREAARNREEPARCERDGDDAALHGVGHVEGAVVSQRHPGGPEHQRARVELLREAGGDRRGGEEQGWAPRRIEDAQPQHGALVHLVAVRRRRCRSARWSRRAGRRGRRTAAPSCPRDR